MDITFLLVAVLGVLLTGIAKSGFGGGIGVIAVPMMAPFMGGEAAIGILLPILLLMDVLTLKSYRQYLSWNLVKPLVPGVVVGIALGTALLGVINESGVEALIGLMGFWILAQKRWSWLGGKSSSGNPPKLLLGSMAGVGSTLAHAGAAPVQGYFLLKDLPKEVFLAQVALTVALMNFLKLVPYGALGLLNINASSLTLVLIPTAFAGVWLGRWLSSKIDGAIFFKIMMWLLGINSTWLLLKAVF